MDVFVHLVGSSRPGLRRRYPCLAEQARLRDACMCIVYECAAHI